MNSKLLNEARLLLGEYRYKYSLHHRLCNQYERCLNDNASGIFDVLLKMLEKDIIQLKKELDKMKLELSKLPHIPNKQERKQIRKDKYKQRKYGSN